MEASNLRVYEAGEVIFSEGEEADRMYILLEGAVALKMKVEKGETVIKVVSTPNDFFGEMALLDGRPRSATAIAERRSKVLVVDGPSFEAMILQNGKFALKVIKVLSERIRRSNDAVSDLIEILPKERIARGMVEFALKHGEKIHDGSYRVGVEAMRHWMNRNLGTSLEELDLAFLRLLKGETISQGVTKDFLLLPKDFVIAHEKKEEGGRDS
jgi:CRP-like cAMP-binding protein